MNKVLLSFMFLWFTGCQKTSKYELQPEIEKDFSASGRYHNHFLNSGLKKMKDIGGYVDVNTLIEASSRFMISNPKLITNPILKFSDMQWYGTGVNLLEHKQQIEAGIDLMATRDKGFLNEIFEIVEQHFSDKKLLKPALILLKKKIESITIPSFEKNKYINTISIAYYSSNYCTDFYGFANFSDATASRISSPPIDIIVQADLFGYVSGHNMIMNTLEPHCQQDPDCLNRHTAWANCNAINNSYIYSSTYSTPNYPATPIMHTSTSCLSD